MSAKRMNKVLNIRQLLKDLETIQLKWKDTEEQPEAEREDATLKHAILRLIGSAGNLADPLSDDEKQNAYEAGRIIGMEQSKNVELTDVQYNVVKKIADCNKILVAGEKLTILGFLFEIPVRRMIDAAENMKTGDSQQDGKKSEKTSIET